MKDDHGRRGRVLTTHPQGLMSGRPMSGRWTRRRESQEGAQDHGFS